MGKTPLLCVWSRRLDEFLLRRLGCDQVWQEVTLIFPTFQAFLLLLPHMSREMEKSQPGKPKAPNLIIRLHNGVQLTRESGSSRCRLRFERLFRFFYISLSWWIDHCISVKSRAQPKRYAYLVKSKHAPIRPLQTSQCIPPNFLPQYHDNQYCRSISAAQLF